METCHSEPPTTIAGDLWRGHSSRVSDNGARELNGPPLVILSKLHMKDVSFVFEGPGAPPKTNLNRSVENGSSKASHGLGFFRHDERGKSSEKSIPSVCRRRSTSLLPRTVFPHTSDALRTVARELKTDPT